MTKNSILLIFLLSASFLLGLKAQECQVTYYGIAPPPDCYTYIDENGEEEEQCTSVGPGVSVVYLNADASSYSEPTLPLSQIDFTGTCDCTLKLYSGSNFSGCYVRNDVATTSFEHIWVNDIWSRGTPPQSFSVSCDF